MFISNRLARSVMVAVRAHFIALMLIIVFGVISHSEASAERRVALVIGNAEYKNTAVLANPRNDAQAIAAALTRLGFDVVLALDVTQRRMADVVREFSERLRGADVALLFYAGHGLSYEGQNYIVPVDASARDELDITFGMHQIRSVTEQMARKARVNIVMLDACRDNPLVRGLSRSLGGSRSAALGKGLSRIEQVGRQSYVMLATKDGEVAADGTGRHSPFTQELLQHIEVPGLTIEAIARRVRKGVREATRDGQIPIEINSLDDAFYFRPPPADASATGSAVTQPTTSDDDRRRDWLYWESIKDMESLEMLRSYIDRFPAGEFVDVAKAQIRQLESQTARQKEKAGEGDADEAYRAAVTDGSETALRDFVNSFPDHPKAKDLKAMLDERAAWRAAERSDTRTAFERYLTRYPKGLYALAARERIAALAAQDVRSMPSPEQPSQTSNPPQTSYTPPQTGSFAPSYDCSKSTHAAESAICSSRRLAELDVQLAQIYALVRGRMSKQQVRTLRNAQRQWLRRRNSCGWDTSCIERYYQSRIQELRARLG